jgi:hypothetical protein
MEALDAYARKHHYHSQADALRAIVRGHLKADGSLTPLPRRG